MYYFTPFTFSLLLLVVASISRTQINCEALKKQQMIYNL